MGKLSLRGPGNVVIAFSGYMSRGFQAESWSWSTQFPWFGNLEVVASYPSEMG